MGEEACVERDKMNMKNGGWTCLNQRIFIAGFVVCFALMQLQQGEESFPVSDLFSSF